MASTIKIKNSSTTGAVPTSSDLVQGELAINVTDRSIYTENASGTVVKLNAPSIDDKNTGATKYLTIDTSGNLGLGVSPSSWRASQTAIQFGSTGGYAVLGAGYATNAMVQVGTNFYVNSSGNSIYASSNAASNYNQVNGAHAWYYAASGTQGNSISFTQAMTLDASGRLVIGGTTATTGALLTVGTSGGGSNVIHIPANTGAFTSFPSTGTVLANGYSLTYLTYQADGLIFSKSGGSEAARIDSSGNLLVGTTSTGLKTARSMGFQVSGGCVQYISHSTSDASGDSYVEFGYNGTKIGSITQNGTTAVLYNTTSDYRLKTVIGSVTGAGERIDALEPVEYEWNSDGSRTRGFLAHKFQEVYAGSVSGTKDAVDADGNPLYQSMQAGSSEVIADLVAEIQSLRQRLATAGI